MSKGVVLIPFRGGGDSAREGAHAYVVKWWEKNGWRVVSADSTSERFNRAEARNRAAELAGDWDIAMFCDADTVLDDPLKAQQAMKLARDGILVQPHRLYGRLRKEDTARLVRSGKVPARRMCYWIRSSPSPGAMHAIRRDLFEAIRGWDEGFIGWGFEDSAFTLSCQVLAGRKSLAGFVFHLWHPEDERRTKRDTETDEAYRSNRQRWYRYERAARAGPDAMRDLIAELRA